MKISFVQSVAVIALAGLAGTAPAQIRAVDPNTAIDADLGTPQAGPAVPPASSVYYDYSATPPADAPAAPPPAAPMQASQPAQAAVKQSPAVPVQTAGTYKRDDLIGAAESVFGKGAKGLATLIERVLKDQGEPTGYISGREASGAFVVGLRYGSGTLFHRVEGQKPVYWTGPSIGFDAGANAASTFVLVYNLHDGQELYQRFPAGEGNAYFVGGLTASYMRSGDIVLIPIRLGAGVRLGANVGYMKFTDKARWLPF